MDDLLDDFVAETREMLDALQGEIVTWEVTPHDRDRLDSIFRFFHTVKGNCGFFDFPRLEALSHAAEDALTDVRAGRRKADSSLVNAVLAIVDRISLMVQSIEAGQEFPEISDAPLIAGLAINSDDPDPQAALLTEPAASSASAQRSVRISVDLMDRLMNGVSDVVLARNELARRLRAGETGTTIEAPFERLSGILGDIREAVTKMRMQPIDKLFMSFTRLVRDLSNDLGKQVMINLQESDVELDREIIEMIRDPFTHIIRNAIDHGIETPAQRLEAGKREIGLITVGASQSGNHVEIVVVDDGRGINGDQLVAKAITAGLISEAEAAQMSLRERYALIFEPGLSTAETVTSVSGRGVGMDVVRANIERAGGSILVDSKQGEGTFITLRLPLTLSIMPALTVGAAGQKFAIPRSAVEEIVRAQDAELDFTSMGRGLLATIRGRRLPCVVLGDVLGLESEFELAQSTLVVIHHSGGDLFALAVDQIHDHEELVVKPLTPMVMATGVYAGSTLLDDGSPILMLDTAGLAREAQLNLDVLDRSARIAGMEVAASVSKAETVLLFAGLDGRHLAIRMEVIRRIEEVSRADVCADMEPGQAVIGEKILPLAGLTGDDLPEEKVRLLRLGDGNCEIAYALREIIDIKTIETELVPLEERPGIEGATLIDGQMVEVLDCYWLFGRLGRSGAQSQELVCRMPSDDPWFRNFLRPLVESVGYRVIGEADDGDADIAIALRGGETGTANGGQVIWLRATPDEAPEDDGTIYRYDHASLIAALHSAPARRAR